MRWSLTRARAELRKRGVTPAELREAYIAVAVEVPPRRGASFSMRYTTVETLGQAWMLLTEKMKRKKVGMIGEVLLVSPSGIHTVSLGGYVRRSGGRLESFGRVKGL